MTTCHRLSGISETIKFKNTRLTNVNANMLFTNVVCEQALETTSQEGANLPSDSQTHSAMKPQVQAAGCGHPLQFLCTPGERASSLSQASQPELTQQLPTH